MRALGGSGETSTAKITTVDIIHHNNNNYNNKNRNMQNTTNNNSLSTTISLPKPQHANNTNDEITSSGVQDTIYLCNFRVSVDGEWLCLKELQDLDIQDGKKTSGSNNLTGGGVPVEEINNGHGNFGIGKNERCFYESTATNNQASFNKSERDWVNYYCRWLLFCIYILFLFCQ